jgi:outer membrane protein assembly factor BamB
MSRHNYFYLAAIASLLILSPVYAEDWYRWRGPRLDGISNEVIDFDALGKDRPRTLWTAHVGTGFSSVSVADGKVYTAGNVDQTDFVYCLDAQTGGIVWKHGYPSELWAYLYQGGTNCTPTVDGDRVYFLGRHGELLCLDAGDGRVVWERQLRDELSFTLPDWGFTSAPLILEDVLIVNAGSYGAAFDKATGHELWMTGTGKGGYALTVPLDSDSESALLVFTPTELAAVARQRGDVLWTVPWPTSFGVNAADPIVSKNEVFVSSAYNHGCALLKVSSSGVGEVWRNKELRTHFAPSLLIGGHIYGIDGNDGRNTWLKCLDWKTGAVRWSELRGLGTGGLAAAGNALIVLTETGELVFVASTPEKFQVLARWQIDELTQGSETIDDPKCWTPPVLSNDLIYCRNSAGVLVCLDLPTK